MVNMVLRRDRQSDKRRYNAPTSNEIAMIFVNEDGEPPFERDIRVYPKNPQDPDQHQHPQTQLGSHDISPSESLQ